MTHFLDFLLLFASIPLFIGSVGAFEYAGNNQRPYFFLLSAALAILWYCAVSHIQL